MIKEEEDELVQKDQIKKNKSTKVLAVDDRMNSGFFGGEQ